MLNKAIIGKKVGMTQIFDADGKVIPVTVIEAGPCVVTQVKTAEKEGYNAVQLRWRYQALQRKPRPHVSWWRPDASSSGFHGRLL